MHGGQGTGKSLLGALMARILGKHNMSQPGNDQLKSQFNGWLCGKSLVVIEELMSGGSSRGGREGKPAKATDHSGYR
jgi:hypothetical protein